MWAREKHKAKKHNIKHYIKQKANNATSDKFNVDIIIVTCGVIFDFLFFVGSKGFRILKSGRIRCSLQYRFLLCFCITKNKIQKFKNLKRCTFIIVLKLSTHFREKRLLQWKNNM